ncbi:MAG: ATP-dependent Clp protease ATP-binding subunit [Bacilli bacterium]|nr:ATP-dependent Clp protease ATP-binding subunit [Bacilli bacterium]
MNNESFLDKYGEDLTAVKYITNPAIARDKELKELVMVLLTPEKSACLVGKPGIGKTAIVEGLAYHMQMNDMPKALQGYKVYKISTPALLGVTDGENKVIKLVNEIKQREKVIIFIDEIHMLMGANRENGPMDLANMFKEGLGRGSVKLIGATTVDEYERYVLRDKAFTRRLERIDVSEPTGEQCVEILMKTIPKIEVQTGVKFNYTEFVKENVVKFIVNMTSEYKRVYEISARYPDIALTVLRQCFSAALFNNSSEVKFRHIYDAIRNTKVVYPDVIRKELKIFADTFEDELKEENIVVEIPPEE